MIFACCSTGGFLDEQENFADYLKKDRSLDRYEQQGLRDETIRRAASDRLMASPPKTSDFSNVAPDVVSVPRVSVVADPQTNQLKTVSSLSGETLEPLSGQRRSDRRVDVRTAGTTGTVSGSPSTQPVLTDKNDTSGTVISQPSPGAISD